MSELPAALHVRPTREYVGWEVVDQEGAKVGGLADLLIDRQGRVRYLDVEHGLPKKHVLVPITRAEWGDDRFILALPKDQVRALPPYEPGRALDDALLDDLARAYPWIYGDEAVEWSEQPGTARVVPLSEARDFRIESGAPDLRGWNVFGADGERLGTVAGLLVDPAALKVRYLEVDLHDDLFLARDDRHVLVPIDQVDLKERGQDVWVKELTARDVARFPAYTGGPVLPAMERYLNDKF